MSLVLFSFIIILVSQKRKTYFSESSIEPDAEAFRGKQLFNTGI